MNDIPQKYSDEVSVDFQWRISTLKFFEQAIERYIKVLSPYDSERNKTIHIELQQMHFLLEYTQEIIEKSDDDYDIVQFLATAKTYGKIYDMLWKFYNYKKNILEEREHTIPVAAAHEGDEVELEEINKILQLEAWQKFDRKKCLVPDFIGVAPKKITDPIQQQIHIGSVYGQFVGVNNGTMVQNNNQDVMEALNALTKIMAESKISDNDKQDALGDIQTIQAQVTKKSPNRKIMEVAFVGLQVAANMAQIASFAIPYMDKIRTFIQSLPSI